MACELCLAFKNKEGKSVSKSFFTLVCRTCVGNVSMLVLKEHRTKLMKSEYREADNVRKKYFPDRRFRGYMRKIKNHWHDHLVK